MPRKTRKQSQLSRARDLNISVASSSTDFNESRNIGLSALVIREKFEEALKHLDDELAGKLSKLRLEYNNIILMIPKEIRNKVINLNDLKLKRAILESSENCVDLDSTLEPATPIPTTVKRRRSKSATARDHKFLQPEAASSTTDLRRSNRVTRVRSSSVDMYKTPRNKVRLSTLTSTAKYTVSKPRKIEKDSGLSIKRIMKPGEQAISTSGSPLHVQANNAMETPQVNIPLPGGVVLNIEPKKPRGPINVPELDDRTRRQIELLVEHLQQMC